MPVLARLPTVLTEDTEISRRSQIVFKPVKRPVLLVIGAGRRGFWELGARDVVIGRDPSCQVSIPADAAASRRHALLRPRRGSRGDTPQFEIEDLGSLNGTLVNDQPVDGPVLLVEHDKIQIGNTSFKFMVRDEDELASERELIALATQDALTGLLNRGAFDHHLALEFDRARRYGRPLALVMIDIDVFKGINDRYGHVTGDRVLSAVGQTVKAALRTCDHAGRYGGEELAVVLPETGLEGAFLAGERIRLAIADSVVHDPSVVLRVTVSVGVAELGPDHAEPADLLQAADRALYQAKGTGRNRTCTAGG